MLFPDATISANIYCGDLDGLIRGAVTPFRTRLREELRGPWSLWMMRYTRGGQHLKVRLHGPEDEAPRVRALLAEVVEPWLAALPEGDPAARVSRPKATPVDEEDEAREDRPDRTLLWTTYRRSPVSLGPSGVLRADDGFVGRMTVCLSAGAELVVQALAEPLSASARLKTLLRLVAGAVTAVEADPERRAAYLTYHRDWLLRFALPHRDAEVEMLDKFEARVRGMGPVLDEAFAAVCRWDDGAEDADASPAETRWRAAFADLFQWMSARPDHPACAHDPFTDNPAYPPVFKSLHGTANQLGTDMLNEALVHHILLRALAGQGAGAAAAAHAQG